MKRTLLKLTLAALYGNTIAQQPFLTKTCYRGAFAPAPTSMWTDRWTNWDPQNTVYPAPTMTVSGNITSNTTWSAGTTVLLSAQCYVRNNSVLTIQPGVTILGDKSVAGAGLFITKGSQIIAAGNAAAPIVFTSNQAPGARDKGDWGGLVILGKGANNSPNGVNYIEGLPFSGDTEFGGGTSPDNNDNSGVLSYVRIEFPGYVYQPDKEINGITFGSVGRGTQVDHIQVSFSNDDAFEWFGGAVNCRYLVAYRCLDDNFDTDFGYSGTVQFCLGVRDPSFADNPNVSTSEGFESDNDASGSTASPLTSALFSNVTDIGPLRGVPTATVHSGFRRGARIRRNSNLKIYNSIFMDHATRGIFIDGSAAEHNANAGSLKFMNNVMAGYGIRASESGAFGIISGGLNAWLIANKNDTLKSAAGILTSPYNYTSPDYRPSPGSIALTNADFTDALIAVQSDPATPLVAFSNATTQCVDPSNPFIFTATPSLAEGYCSLQWSVTSGVTISDAASPNPSFTITTAGNHTLTLSVLYGAGASMATKEVMTYTCLDVSVRENRQIISEALLIPNPAGSSVSVSLIAAEHGEALIHISDLTGRVVKEHTTMFYPGHNLLKLDSSALPEGVYIVTIDAKQSKETVKLLISH